MIKNLLLTNKIDINLVNKKTGETVLITASRTGNKDEVQDILLNNIDINFVNKKTGKTALMTACEYGHIEIMKLLIQNGANLYHNNDNGGNILLCCHDKKTIEFLLEQGIDINLRNEKNETILEKMCLSPNIEVVEFLLENGANPNVLDKNGEYMIDTINSARNALVNEENENDTMFSEVDTYEDITFLLEKAQKTFKETNINKKILQATKNWDGTFSI